MSKPLTIDTAKELLHAHVLNPNLRKHCYAVGVALAGYYDYYKSQNKDSGKLSRNEWEISGILHDADWEETKDDPKLHTIKLLSWLKDYDVPSEMVDVFKSHNYEFTNLKKPQSLLEKTLECCDELTGFIVAVALIMPTKKLFDVRIENVLKKFKQKEFARAVSRKQIELCEDEVAMSTDDFIKVTLESMQKNSDLLGL